MARHHGISSGACRVCPSFLARSLVGRPAWNFGRANSLALDGGLVVVASVQPACQSGMWSHIRAINFGYYSKEGKVCRSNANKWFYERILFAIIRSMDIPKRINTARVLVLAGWLLGQDAFARAVRVQWSRESALIIGSWYQRWMHRLLWYGGAEIDRWWLKVGRMCFSCIGIIVLSVAELNTCARNIDLQTKCTGFAPQRHYHNYYFETFEDSS